MTTRQAIIEAARAVVGARWRRGGRDPRAGLDCAGLVAFAAAGVGYPIVDRANYGIDGDGRLLEYMRESFDEVPIADLQPGDIPLFRMNPSLDTPASHCAILTETRGLIHVFYHVRAVVEQGMSPEWESRIKHVVRFRGVQPWQP